VNVKEYILARLDIAAFYRAVFDDYNPGNNVRCPFAARRGHSKRQKDDVASMSLSEDGKVYCHACGYKATSPIGLIEDLLKISFKAACLYTFKEYISPVVNSGKIRILENVLHKNTLALYRLKKKRGITARTATKYRLGWHGGRLSIPIFNDIGYCVDIRQYDLFGKFKKGTKVISWKKGFGGARLWPLESLQNKTVFLMEGETDTILALQEGLPGLQFPLG